MTFLATFFSALVLPAVLAAEKSENDDTELPRLRDRVVASIATLSSPDEKAGADADLAKLLIVAGDLEGARACVTRMGALEEVVRKGPATVRFATTLAELLLRLGDTEAAGQVIHRVDVPRQRAEVLLNVAGSVLSADQQAKDAVNATTNTTAPVWTPDAVMVEQALRWLREARKTVAEIDAPELAVVAPALLARELALQGGESGLAEARELFAEAAEKTRKMEAVEGNEYLALLVKYLVDAKLDADAQALAETGADEEFQESLRAQYAISVLQAGRSDGVRALLSKIKNPKTHDVVLAYLLRTLASAEEKAPTEEELAALAKEAKTETFLTETHKPILAVLLETRRYETALAWNALARDKQSDLLVRSLWMKTLFQENRIPEAEKLADGLEDAALVEPLKRNVRREVGFQLLREDKTESGTALLTPLHDPERIKLLGEELATVDDTAAPESVLQRLAPIYRGYLDCGDFGNAKIVWDRMRQNAVKIANPQQRFAVLAGVMRDGAALGDLDGTNALVDSVLTTLAVLPQPPAPEKVKFCFQLIERYRVRGETAFLNSLLARTETQIDALEDPVQKCGALIVLYRMRFEITRSDTAPATDGADPGP